MTIDRSVNSLVCPMYFNRRKIHARHLILPFIVVVVVVAIIVIVIFWVIFFFLIKKTLFLLNCTKFAALLFIFLFARDSGYLILPFIYSLFLSRTCLFLLYNIYIYIYINYTRTHAAIAFRNRSPSTPGHHFVFSSTYSQGC